MSDKDCSAEFEVRATKLISCWATFDARARALARPLMGVIYFCSSMIGLEQFIRLGSWQLNLIHFVCQRRKA